MTDVMAHRGPDDQGIWHDERGRCSLGHRRLSIIDTSSAGHQPMFDSSGRWVISYNGEIYNFNELRAQLQASGVQFRGRTDTEVLLAALVQWGVDALPKIDGMFALAAFDRESGQLILARDAFGEKPLYYAELAAGGLAFASELQALELIPEIETDVNADAVAELLMFQYIAAPRTIYATVSKLPPGHWLVAYPGQAVRIGKYFEFRPGSTGFDNRPIGQLADELEDVLLRSLSRRLISDVPLGAFLSGGVDSSTMCALIRRRLDVPLRTFSIGFQGAQDSEHLIARTFAQHLGTEHHERIVAPNVTEFLLNIGRVLDEPNADSSCLPTYMLSAFARESVTVALSGDGGDEMFGGYDRYFMTLDEAQRTTATNWSAGNAYYSGRILVSVEQQIEELFGYVPAGALEHLERLRADVDRSDAALFCRLRHTDVQNYLPGAVLPKVDRMSMQHSLEVRTPFLNIELARFAERLPLSMLYDGTKGKLPLRELAYRYLPRDLIDLPKRGFGLPISRWGQNELMQAASRLLENDDSRLASAFGADAIARFMRRQRADGGFVTYQVWALAMLESWLRHHPARLGQFDTPRAPTIQVMPVRREPNSVALWKIAEGVLAIVEASAADVSGVESISTMTAAGLTQLAAASSEICRRIINSGQFSPIASSVNWSSLADGSCSQVIKEGLRGASLLLAGDRLASQIGWSELEGLRRLGVVRVVLRHPHRGDGSVISVLLRRHSRWVSGLGLLALFSRAIGSSTFSKAKLEQQKLWTAPMEFEPANGRVDVSEQVALSEGRRQLPPLPAGSADIRAGGDGRYLVTRNRVMFSSTQHSSGRTGRMWMVKRGARTDRLLRFVSEVCEPAAFQHRQPFIGELKALIEADEHDTERVAPLTQGDKLVVVTHALPPGGAERQWVYLAGELKRMGYDVDFVTLSPLRGDDRHYLHLLQSEGVRLIELEQSELDEHETLAAVHSTLDGVMNADPSVRVRDPYPSLLRNLTSLFKRTKPRAVFAQLDFVNLAAAVAGVRAAVPQIVLSFRNFNPTRFSYLANDWYQPLYAQVAQSKRVVLTGNSRAANADYAHWIGVDEHRVRLVPNAIDVAALGSPPETASQIRRELGVVDRVPIVLGVFRLNEEKRPIEFVEVFAAVKAAVPQVRGFVAGVGPFEQRMRKRIDALQVQQSLTLLGRRNDVPQLMRAASVVLLVSAFEGMPNVLMEAQAVGTPVVASNVGGVSDCVVDGVTGYLVDRDDLDGLAQRCIELIENDRLRAKLGASAAAFMKESFSRRAMAERYLAALADAEAEVNPIRLSAA